MTWAEVAVVSSRSAKTHPLHDHSTMAAVGGMNESVVTATNLFGWCVEAMAAV